MENQSRAPFSDGTLRHPQPQPCKTVQAHGQPLEPISATVKNSFLYLISFACQILQWNSILSDRIPVCCEACNDHLEGYVVLEPFLDPSRAPRLGLEQGRGRNPKFVATSVYEQDSLRLGLFLRNSLYNICSRMILLCYI